MARARTEAVVVLECEPSAPGDAASDSTFMERDQDIEDVGRVILQLSINHIEISCE